MNHLRPSGEEEATTQFTLGWREWVCLPDWGIDQLKVKVDTGAKTSALHAFNLRIADRNAGSTSGAIRLVHFDVHPVQRSHQNAVSVVAELVEYRTVRSSTGHTERRPVVQTRLVVGDYSWPIQVTLTNRDAMGFRMLLGREALKGRVLVDPSRSFLVRRS